VKKAIWLSKLIIRGLLQYRENKLAVSMDGNVHEYPMQHVITDEDSFRKLYSLALFRRYFESLRKYGVQCKSVEVGYLCEFKSLTYLIRRYVYEDIIYGPLIQFVGEPVEFGIFMKILKSFEKPVVVDVGAYIGAYTLVACKEGAQVIALEPDPENYNVLKSNIALNRCTDRVKPLMIAAGSKEGLLPLYKGRSFVTSSIVQDFRSATSEVKAYVKVDTLDNILAREASDSRIDYLKIDVEGAEVDVLKGAGETLKRTHYLQVEAFEPNLDKVRTILRRHGFRKLAEIKYEGYRNIIFEKHN